MSNLGIRSNERSDCAMQREQAAVAQLVEQRIRNPCSLSVFNGYPRKQASNTSQLMVIRATGVITVTAEFAD